MKEENPQVAASSSYLTELCSSGILEGTSGMELNSLMVGPTQEFSLGQSSPLLVATLSNGLASQRPPPPMLCLLETSGYVPPCTDDKKLRLGTVIPAFGSLSQEDFHEFKANLGYVVPYHLGYRVSLCLRNDNYHKVFIFIFAGEFFCYDLGVYPSF